MGGIPTRTARRYAMVTKIITITAAGAVLLILSCSHAVEVKPVEVKPIHITIDVNVKIDKALDDFFDEIDEADEALEEKSSTQS